MDGITLMAESEEELKSLLMRVKEESEKAGLKFNVKKLRSWHMVLSLHQAACQLERLEVHGSCIAEAWLGEL